MLITRGLLPTYQQFGGIMFVIKRRHALIISVLLISALTFGICFSAIGRTDVSGHDASSIKIVLDAGHGGVDKGVSGVKTGVAESELNLKTVKKLRDIFTQAGFSVALTREGEDGLYGAEKNNRKKADMLKRREIIRNFDPDIVISVHMNYYSDSSRRGAQVFYNAQSEGGKSLAKCVQASFNGMRECVKKSEALSGDYFILKCCDAPSIIAECGFLSNADDERLLISEEYGESVAYAIFKGAVDYLSVSSTVFCNG